MPRPANLREAHWDADEGICLFGECTFNGWDYSLIHVLQDAGSYLDVVSHHKYGDPADGWCPPRRRIRPQRRVFFTGRETSHSQA